MVQDLRRVSGFPNPGQRGREDTKTAASGPDDVSNRYYSTKSRPDACIPLVSRYAVTLWEINPLKPEFNEFCGVLAHFQRHLIRRSVFRGWIRRTGSAASDGNSVIHPGRVHPHAR